MIHIESLNNNGALWTHWVHSQLHLGATALRAAKHHHQCDSHQRRGSPAQQQSHLCPPLEVHLGSKCSILGFKV